MLIFLKQLAKKVKASEGFSASDGPLYARLIEVLWTLIYMESGGMEVTGQLMGFSSPLIPMLVEALYTF